MALRDHYAYASPELENCLVRFELGDAKLVDVKSFQMLTPDSFIWKLRFSDGMYYLYAEDYAPDLAHVSQQIADYTGGQTGHFVETNDQKEFEHLRAKPKDYDMNMIKYAVDSGFDLVFLYKIDELSQIDKEEL